MNIQAKASIGDKVYFLKQIKHTCCPVCNGTGKIHIGTADTLTKSVEEQTITELMTGNVREYSCPECNGKGIVRTIGQPKYEVGGGTVITVEVTLNRNGEKVIYRVVDSANNVQRAFVDEKLYTDRWAAEKYCKFMNLERRCVPLNNIRIPYGFAATIPCNEKLMRRLDEWRSHRKFETEIYVDENWNLFDGYTSYLVYRMLGILNVPVVIWPKDMRK